MGKMSTWQHDEFKQVGVDYEDQAEIEDYDSRHAQFRDINAECTAILDALSVAHGSVLLEFGTGTGSFAIHAAQRYKKVYAIDVSAPMLKFAEKKAADAGVKNIIFCHAGFLTYQHDGKNADAIVTSMALHHLPDFWKGVALERMKGMLNPGGLLYIHDVIFAQAGYEANITRWLDYLYETGGAELRDEVATHIREEYSTFDWIMDGLLERAGFRVLTRKMDAGVIGTYLCEKK